MLQDSFLVGGEWCGLETSEKTRFRRDWSPGDDLRSWQFGWRQAHTSKLLASEPPKDVFFFREDPQRPPPVSGSWSPDQFPPTAVPGATVRSHVLRPCAFNPFAPPGYDFWLRLDGTWMPKAIAWVVSCVGEEEFRETIEDHSPEGDMGISLTWT